MKRDKLVKYWHDLYYEANAHVTILVGENLSLKKEIEMIKKKMKR
jgi:hypothetical protein